MEAIRLFIVEKNTKVRQALAARLSSSSSIEVVGTSRNAAKGVRRYPELKPDVTLLEARTAGRSKDISALVRALSQQGPSVIVLTSYSKVLRKASRSAISCNVSFSPKFVGMMFGWNPSTMNTLVSITDSIKYSSFEVAFPV